MAGADRRGRPFRAACELFGDEVGVRPGGHRAGHGLSHRYNSNGASRRCAPPTDGSAYSDGHDLHRWRGTKSMVCGHQMEAPACSQFDVHRVVQP